jgi:type VI secretion system protein ImpH
MATESRRTDPAVDELLVAEGYRFEFFQAVRLLERLSLHRAPVGRDAAPAAEAVRFRAQVSLAFPPSEIHEVTPSPDGMRPPEMTVAFMGLTGPLGVLPRHYTELLLERARQKDGTLRDFLDLLNHRLISLFYRAWAKYRFPIGYERAALRDKEFDPFSTCLFDLIGMGTGGLRGRLGGVDDETLIYYAGLIGQRPHSASALDGLLEGAFAVPIDVIQFRGRWLPLSEASRTRLGGRGDPSNVLGVTALLGERVWDQQAGFRLRIGPLGIDRFRDLLPPGAAFRPLVELTRFFAGQELDTEVQLVLRAAEVPRCRLGDTSDGAPRLGWSTWLKTAEFARDADSTLLTGGTTRLGAIPD